MECNWGTPHRQSDYLTLRDASLYPYALLSLHLPFSIIIYLSTCRCVFPPSYLPQRVTIIYHLSMCTVCSHHHMLPQHVPPCVSTIRHCFPTGPKATEPNNQGTKASEMVNQINLLWCCVLSCGYPTWQETVPVSRSILPTNSLGEIAVDPQLCPGQHLPGFVKGSAMDSPKPNTDA